MQTKEKDNLVFIRLFPDEDFYDSLGKACKKHNVKAAVVLCGIGQLKDFELGYFKKKGDYTPEYFVKPHELIALTGNIIKLENYEFHIHATLGKDKKHLVGGHLIKGTVEITNEIVLLKSGIELKRKIDEKTGLKGLFLD